MAGSKLLVDRDAPGGERVPAEKTRAVRSLWTDWRVGLALVIAVATMAALLSAWLTPRGPVTTVEALTSMVAALCVGVVAGVALGNRWSIIVTPAVFIAVFELARIGVEGPTVDGVQLGSVVGALAFAAGRGVHGLLVLLPMMVGSVYGVELASRSGRTTARTMGAAGWIITGLLTVGLVVLGAMIARPASTAPILGPDGEPLAGSIAELTTTRIGGDDQALMIRGTSTDNPVLLHLAGGPGGTDIGAMRLDAGLEQHFTVATWDQRGTGKSYAAIDPTDTLTLDRAVADTVEVTNYLRDRFGQERIFLTGQSWGTIPSVLAVQQHPELYHAYVGTGQMVSPRATDQAFYEDTLAWAERNGNAKLAATLRDVNPPPYEDPLVYATVANYERDLNPYPEFDGHTEMTSTIFVPENTVMDRINALRGLGDTFAVLYPQLQDLDLRTDVPRLDVPVHVVMGSHEAPGRVIPAREWFDRLDAPSKRWIEFEGSSHRASFERPADYTALMTQVLDDTLPATR
jgi:pimeloyl-ACP methyl ester carboxylesterase